MLKRGLCIHHERSSFHGLARNWQKFNELAFQEFAQKHDIDAETVIAVYDEGRNVFGVQIMQ